MHSAMEQTKYLMWSRRKIGSMPPPLFDSPLSMVGAGRSTYHQSWEEQAFAEDSSGLLGGCVWPPRSYSCSFCRREFRSAQALGGHMNVHRRDRARLKQSSSPTRENPEQHPNRTTTPECYTTNPNPNSGVDQYTLVSPSYPPPPPLTVLDEQQQQIDSSFFPIHRPSTNPLPARLLSTIPDLNLGMDNWKLKEMGRMSTLGKREYYQEQVDDIDEMVIGNKRRRFDPPVSPSIAKPTEVLKLGSSPVEELDLELRLGDSPKVK